MKTSTIPLIVLTNFFSLATGIFAILSLAGVREMPLPLSVPLIGSAITTVTMVLASVLGVGLAGFFIYANEEGLVI